MKLYHLSGPFQVFMYVHELNSFLNVRICENNELKSWTA